MGKEVLAIPEQHLEEVIAIIVAGLQLIGGSVNPEVVRNLNKWCDEETEYLSQFKEKPDPLEETVNE